MELSVYSLSAPDYDIPAAAELLADIGYTGVEWTVDYQNALWDGQSNWHIDTTRLAESARAAWKACAEHGLSIVALGARCTLTDVDDVRRHMNVAGEVGSPAIRVHGPGYDGSEHIDTLVARARGALERIENLSRSTGVKALIEIHNGRIVASASGTRRVVDGFDPECVGVIFDPGNMVREGVENWQMGAELLADWIADVHVKNCGWFRGEDGEWSTRDMALDEGLVDWAAVIGALKSVGYDGFLSIEDFRPGYAQASEEFPTRRKLQEDYDYLSGLL
ncbi:MAG: sugar phosphate isomerase/epimerase family protein [Planctomycetota bacterium]